MLGILNRVKKFEAILRKATFFSAQDNYRKPNLSLTYSIVTASYKKNPIIRENFFVLI